MVLWLIFGRGEQWIFETFLLVAVVYFVLNRQVSSGLLKTFLFLLQTAPALIPGDLWPSWWSPLLAKLEAVNLHFWGIECVSGLLAEPLGQFLFYMLLPPAIILLDSLTGMTLCPG